MGSEPCESSTKYVTTPGNWANAKGTVPSPSSLSMYSNSPSLCRKSVIVRWLISGDQAETVVGLRQQGLDRQGPA